MTADDVSMGSHDLANFSVLLLSGVAGALICDPFGRALKLAARRIRTSNARRR